MKVEVVLTEVDLAAELAEAIEARDVPEKFFYWFPRSADAWVALAREASYAGLRDTWRELAGRAESIVAHFDGPVPVISFGAGDGLRDRTLIEALQDKGRECTYFPVDASQALLEMNCGGAEDDDLNVSGIKADISSPVHLVFAADAADAPRLFIMSGNTLGMFDALAEIRYVSQCLKPGDRLIVDGEVFNDQTLAIRDQQPGRQFVATMLSGLGIGNDDGELRYELKRDDRHAGLQVVARYFRAARDISVGTAGEAISIQRGERIGLNFQYAYTPDAFRWLVKEHGGLEIEEELPSPDGRFLTAICRK
jgi:uncharacterized SAM-dependent methyltransferase